MLSVTTELGRESVEGNILPQKVGCERCGAPATLRAIFHYRPHPVSNEHPDDQLPPRVVMILKCPVCGPQTQVKAGNCEVAH
jgi:hypothetical protein